MVANSRYSSSSDSDSSSSSDNDTFSNEGQPVGSKDVLKNTATSNDSTHAGSQKDSSDESSSSSSDSESSDSETDEDGGRVVDTKEVLAQLESEVAKMAEMEAQLRKKLEEKSKVESNALSHNVSGSTSNTGTSATSVDEKKKTKKPFFSKKWAVFVRGLPFSVSPTEIWNVFSDAPDGVKKVEPISSISTTGKKSFEGSAHVTFHSEEGMKHALLWNNEIWNGSGADGVRFIQVVELDQIKGKKQKERMLAKHGANNANVLFIGNLPDNVNKETLKSVFERRCGGVGAVVGVRLATATAAAAPTEKAPAKEDEKNLRNFAHITFSDANAKANALKLNNKISRASIGGNGNSSSSAAGSVGEENGEESKNFLRIREPASADKRKKVAKRAEKKDAEKRRKEKAITSELKRREDLPVGFKNTKKTKRNERDPHKSRDAKRRKKS